MNDILINVLIAFVFIFGMFVPLYLLNKKSKEQRKVRLGQRLVYWTNKEGLAPGEVRIIGNKAFGIDAGNRKVLILSVAEKQEDVSLLDARTDKAVRLDEVVRNDQVFELRLVYASDKHPREFLLYKQFRDNEYDIKALKEVTERIKEILN